MKEAGDKQIDEEEGGDDSDSGWKITFEMNFDLSLNKYIYKT